MERERAGQAEPETGWTRRGFVRGFGGMAMAARVLPSMTGLTGATLLAKSSAAPKQRYRAVSWWLTFDDLAWPNADLRDAIRRRADRCAANGVNCCLVFGAHLRWDFLPLWSRLHDFIRTVAAELHERHILLFDHHSSALTHRPRTAEEALNISQRNRHHLPFYPSREAAATWEFNGSRLNEWRMMDVETGDPVYLSAYEAEQFCMNNPAFRAAYARYVRQLVAETGIDGLMSDDGIFYANWRACGCAHCRERFRLEHRRELPPTTDASFWGNRRNEAFRDWIEMRFRSSGDFLLHVVRANLPAGFPLLTCCSSSDGPALPGFGMSYQDFIQSCDHVLLEMVGSTPGIDGTWDSRIPSQLLHLGIAREHRVPCFGLGYGFFPDTAFFTWALNKFLGSDCWFSTLKGRLGASAEQLAALADDAELVGEGFQWERTHPDLFAGDVDTDIAVLFSRTTRDFYGQVGADYTNDYHATCLHLVRQQITYDVVTTVPALGRVRRLILSSVVCLSAEERRALASFMAGGGTVVATGPCGFCDARANPIPQPWLHEFALPVEWTDPARSGGFPPYKALRNPIAIAECRVSGDTLRRTTDGWYDVPVGKGRLLWRPERIAAKGIAASRTRWLEPDPPTALRTSGLPAGWHTRQFRDGTRRLVHFLPAKIGTVLHPVLKNQMGQQAVIEKLRFTPLEGALTVRCASPLARVILHSPDLAESREAKVSSDGGWQLNLVGLRRYFILECVT